MTPQLQQAIRMLQLSSIELQTEIQEALDSNLMLEEGSEESRADDAGVDETYGEPAQPSAADTPSRDEPLDESYAEPEADTVSRMESEIPDELAVDSAWDDIYDMAPSAGAATTGDDDREFEHGDNSSESLREHLLWQIRMMPLSATDQRIAESIIDGIDDNGLLSVSLDEVLEGVRRDDPAIEMDEVETVLHMVQSFEPVGVAARDLRECLLLQLRALPAQTPWRDEALQLLQELFAALAGRDFNQIKRRLKLDDEELTFVTRLIQSLNPRPGSQISNSRTEYIAPDVIVRKVKGSWRVELNAEATPRLRINTQYARLARQAKGEDATTLKNHLQEARWLIKSLQSRNETLLKVATSIVEHQRDFLEKGEVGMKPMVLHDIAEELGMHESTISRTTTRKYMHTPRGIFELKYFFSSHVGTASGGECSSTAIRAMLKKLIGEESPNKPLSDSRLTEILSAEGINVARRTVAKYREAMAIPPSNERKRLV